MAVSENQKKVLDQIDSNELVKLAEAMGNTTAPTGYEQAMADFVLDWLRANGFQNSFQQRISEDRSNTIGIFKGKGGGKTLIFNSHMDTGDGIPARAGDPLPAGPRSWVEGTRLYGKTVVNDRGPMAAFMIATKAIRDSGISLKGDIIMTMVVGEIGMGPVDEFQGPKYIGKGLGSRHAVTHGATGDFALIAETTNFGVTWVEAGAAYFKVSLSGKSLYTPKLPKRGIAVKDNPSALLKMIPVIQAIEQWGAEYEEKYTKKYAAGLMVPKVGIGAIRAGQPYKPSVAPASCSIYVDVRVPPFLDFTEVERQLKEVVLSQGLGGEVQMFMGRRGYEGKNIEPLVEAIRNAHKVVRGTDCPPMPEPETSMWRDVNIFNEVGIPAATFGFTRNTPPKGEDFTEIPDLIDCVKMYALVAMQICGMD
jgi:acetylornithine deacetylase/succinyl-diaminopimelate desuccinylase-like protein